MTRDEQNRKLAERLEPMPVEPPKFKESRSPVGAWTPRRLHWAEYDGEILCREIERNVDHVLKPYLAANDMAISHLEAASGSLHDTFGVAHKSILGSRRSYKP